MAEKLIELRRLAAEELGPAALRLVLTGPDALDFQWMAGCDDGVQTVPGEESRELWRAYQPGLLELVERFKAAAKEDFSLAELAESFALHPPQVSTLIRETAGAYGVDAPERGSPGRWKNVPRAFVAMLLCRYMPVIEKWAPSSALAHDRGVSLSLVNQLCFEGAIEARQVLKKWHVSPFGANALEARIRRRDAGRQIIEKDGRSYYTLAYAAREALRLHGSAQAGVESDGRREHWYKRFLYAAEKCPQVRTETIGGIRYVDRENLDRLLDLISLTEAEALSGLSKYRVRSALSSGDLPTVMVGRTPFTLRSAVISHARSAELRREVESSAARAAEEKERLLRQEQASAQEKLLAELISLEEKKTELAKELQAAVAEKEAVLAEVEELRRKLEEENEPRSFRFYWGEPRKFMAKLTSSDEFRSDVLDHQKSLLEALRGIREGDEKAATSLADINVATRAIQLESEEHRRRLERIREHEEKLAAEHARLKEISERLKGDVSGLVEGPKSFRMYWGSPKAPPIPEALKRNAELELLAAKLRGEILKKDRMLQEMEEKAEVRRSGETPAAAKRDASAGSFVERLKQRIRLLEGEKKRIQEEFRLREAALKKTLRELESRYREPGQL